MKSETVQLKREDVVALFEKHDNATDIIVALYRMVYNDQWDIIANINGYPVCNKHTALELMKMFQEFDSQKNQNQNVMPGGLWFNKGFSACDSKAETLQNWEILPCNDLEFIR